MVGLLLFFVETDEPLVDGHGFVIIILVELFDGFEGCRNGACSCGTIGFHHLQLRLHHGSLGFHLSLAVACFLHRSFGSTQLSGKHGTVGTNESLTDAKYCHIASGLDLYAIDVYVGR